MERKGKKSATGTTHFHCANGVAAVFAHPERNSQFSRVKNLFYDTGGFLKSEDDSIQCDHLHANDCFSF